MPAVDTEEFVCECGFSTKTKSGLGNHKRKCPKLRYGTLQVGPDGKLGQVQAPHPKAEPILEPIPITPEPSRNIKLPPIELSTTDRNQFSKRILDRKEAILTALNDILDGDPEKVLDKLRRDKGVVLTVQQLNELIEGVDKQIEEDITEHIKDEQERLKVAIADLDEDFEEKELELKERHRQEVKALIEEKKVAKAKLDKELKDAKDKVIEAKAKDLYNQREKYKHDMLVARQVEQEIQFTAQQQTALLKRSRGMLLHTINDATNRALEQLLVVRTREEAGALIELIPTVNEAIQKCQSADGFNAFVRRLDPTMMLPAPAPIDPAKLKKAEAAVEAEEAEAANEDQGSENSEEEAMERHDDIYEELDGRASDPFHRRRDRNRR